MTSYTAAELKDIKRNWNKEDEARMQLRPAGMPKAAWRIENPVTTKTILAVLDGNFKTRPERTMAFDTTGTLEVFIFSSSGRLVERIDLEADDANQRLSRYEIK